MRKWIKLAKTFLVTSMLMLTTITYGAQETKPVLTLEGAIALARSFDNQLGIDRASEKLAKEVREDASENGTYVSYINKDIDYQYASKKVDVREKTIVYDISKLFDDILLTEKRLEVITDSIHTQEKALRVDKLSKEVGLKTDLDLTKAELEYEKSKQLKQKLEEALELQYSILCSKIGSSTKRYQLEKPSIVYEPYEIKGNVDGVISSLASQNLEVWKTMQQADRYEMDWDALYMSGNNYVTYTQMKTQGTTLQHAQELTKTGYEQLLRSKYNEILALQEDYTIKQKEVEVLEKDIQKNKLYLEKGLITPLQYEQMESAYNQKKLELEEVIVKQEYTKQLLNNPYLLTPNQ